MDAPKTKAKLHPLPTASVRVWTLIVSTFFYLEI